MAILVMEAMTKLIERRSECKSLPTKRCMLKANNNYKAFYQMTMEDLHDSDIPEYRQVDKKRFKTSSANKNHHISMMHHRIIII
jgi:hypothetical protein